jgi:hypothetical protein
MPPRAGPHNSVWRVFACAVRIRGGLRDLGEWLREGTDLDFAVR